MTSEQKKKQALNNMLFTVCKKLKKLYNIFSLKFIHGDYKVLVNDKEKYKIPLTECCEYFEKIIRKDEDDNFYDEISFCYDGNFSNVYFQCLNSESITVNRKKKQFFCELIYQIPVESYNEELDYVIVNQCDILNVKKKIDSDIKEYVNMINNFKECWKNKTFLSRSELIPVEDDLEKLLK